MTVTEIIDGGDEVFRREANNGRSDRVFQRAGVHAVRLADGTRVGPYHCLAAALAAHDLYRAAADTAVFDSSVLSVTTLTHRLTGGTPDQCVFVNGLPRHHLDGRFRALTVADMISILKRSAATGRVRSAGEVHAALEDALADVVTEPVRPSAERFDRFWPYPEPTARLAPLLADDAQRAAWEVLLTRGDPEEIREWIDRTRPPAATVAIIEQALPADEDGFCPTRFDEVHLGHTALEDGPGTCEYFLVRRVGPKFYCRVHEDGAGEDLDAWTQDRRPTRKQVEEAIRPHDHPDFPGEGVPGVVYTVWDLDGTWRKPTRR